MTYSEELKAFRATHTYETKIVEGSTFHYVLSGKMEKRWYWKEAYPETLCRPPRSEVLAQLFYLPSKVLPHRIRSVPLCIHPL